MPKIPPYQPEYRERTTPPPSDDRASPRFSPSIGCAHRAARWRSRSAGTRLRSAGELWTTYIQLTEAEVAFRTVKGEFAIRPLFHRLERRVKAHVVVAVLGYALRVTLNHPLRRVAAPTPDQQRLLDHPGLTVPAPLE